MGKIQRRIGYYKVEDPPVPFVFGAGIGSELEDEIELDNDGIDLENEEDVRHLCQKEAFCIWRMISNI